MYSHHDARYNLIEISKQLILIEEHLAGNRCADCLTKHYLTVQALAAEGLRLEHGQEEPYRSLLTQANQVAQKHLTYVLHDQGNKIPEMITEVRQLRKNIFNQVLGISDIHHEQITIE